MRRGLSIDDLGDLLDCPIVATLATYRLDGTVLLSPVWHEYREGGFNAIAGADDVKVRHLRRDPRSCLVVYDQTPPYRGLELSCSARLVGDRLVETRCRIAIRYLGKKEGLAYAASVGGDECIIRLEPGVVRAWDFSDEYGHTARRGVPGPLDARG